MVDDEPSVLAAIERALRPLGHELDLARTATDAILRLENQAYDLLVTDLMMPKRTGFDIFEKLLFMKSRIPVVVVSGYVKADALKGFSANRIEIVTKPFKAEALADVVRKLLAPPPAGGP